MRLTPSNLVPIGLIIGLLSSPVALGDIQLELSAPDQFLDLKMPEASAAKGQEQFIRAMKRELSGLSEKHLGDKQELKITFEQVDLAGHIAPMVGRTSQETRVINSLDPVRLRFTYQVTGVDGTIERTGSEDLKHFVTQTDMRGRNRNRELFLERRMMHEWFVRTFVEETS